MTVSADNPRAVIKEAGGSEVEISKVLKDEELGTVDLRGTKGHVLRGQDYTDEKGVERSFVQLESGGLVAIPKSALKGNRSRSGYSSIPRRVWERIFGKK